MPVSAAARSAARLLASVRDLDLVVPRQTPSQHPLPASSGQHRPPRRACGSASTVKPLLLRGAKIAGHRRNSIPTTKSAPTVGTFASVSPSPLGGSAAWMRWDIGHVGAPGHPPVMFAAGPGPPPRWHSGCACPPVNKKNKNSPCRWPGWPPSRPLTTGRTVLATSTPPSPAATSTTTGGPAVGDVSELPFCFSAADVRTFAILSGDTNG